MVHQQLAKLGPEFAVKIGEESIAVKGSMELGWVVLHAGDSDHSPYRYATVDELAFVLINLSLTLGGDVGSA
ncbi:MAG: hypothetical protein ABI629_23025 [bacterium]